MKLVYFAWVRERIGKPEEERLPPAGVETVAELIAWLKQQGEEYGYAFEKGELIRVALDKCHARHDAPLAGVREAAFFPPMTGG